MKKNILSALIGLAVIVSCEKKQEEHAEHMTTEQTATQDNAEQAGEAKSDEHDEHSELAMNNGEKWAVNDEMKPYIAEAEAQLKAYQPETDAYKMLAANLSISNENLVKSCTMTGVPHDNLHAWLAPHMKEIEKLKNAESREQANKIVDELKESMEKYHEYFN